MDRESLPLDILLLVLSSLGFRRLVEIKSNELTLVPSLLCFLSQMGHQPHPILEPILQASPLSKMDSSCSSCPLFSSSLNVQPSGPRTRLQLPTDHPSIFLSFPQKWDGPFQVRFLHPIQKSLHLSSSLPLLHRPC